MPVPYQRHGRRHATDGEDPIPGLAAGGTHRNTAVKYAMFGPEFKVSGLYQASAATKTIDNTVPFGGYISYASQNKYFVMGAPLGPKGSTWCVSIAAQEDADCGQLLLEWQTTLVDGVFTGFGFGAGPFVESVEGPETTNTTWYKDNSATTFHEDLYAAAPTDIYQTFYSPIRIGGDDDAMLSAHGTAVSDSPWAGARTQREMNGGGNGNVMWWLRVSNPSKNASSSGYRMRIYYIAIRRVENTTGFVIG